VPVGIALGFTLYRFPLAAPLLIAGGVGPVAVLGLAIARRNAAVALGVLLLGVVVVEPSPSDAVFVVVIAVAWVTGRLRWRDAPRPVVAILAVLGALNLMSAVQVVDAGRAVVFFGITLYLAILGIWLPGYVTSRGRARLILRAYVAAAVASAAIGIAGLLAPVPGGDLLTESGRARALFQDPNVFGPFLIPALLMLVEEMLSPRLLRARLPTKALLAAILTLGVLFSYSRGAWLNLAVGLAVMGAVLTLRPGGARHALALLGAAAAAAVVVAAILVATGSMNFLVERARPQTYDTQRFRGQRASLRPAEHYPFGAGPGQFESVAGISAHSAYARAVGEQGFPGLIVLLALLGYTLACAASNAVRGRSTCGIGSAALLGAWCGLLANSAFIDTLHWRHVWLLAALIWAGAMRARRDTGSDGC
jgi:O-antigen ligase